MIGNGIQIGTFDFGAQTVVDINSQKVFEGVAFSWAKRFTVPASATPGATTIDIIIDPTAIPEEKSLIVLPIGLTAFGAGPIDVDFYFGAIYDDQTGDEWDCFNRDNESTNECNTKLFLAPTISNIGTLLAPEFFIPSDGTPAVAQLGGQSKDDLIFKARKDGNYMLRFKNRENTDALAHLAMTIFEVGKK